MKVVLIGDSIRGGYYPLVAKKLSEAKVWTPPTNCRHSVWVLDHFKEWVADQNPDVVHVNFGIHDADVQPDGEHQILLAQYGLSLKRFLIKMEQELPAAKIIWATTTPLYIPTPDQPMDRWPERAAAEIDAYNAAALEIVQGQGIPVNDLHDVVIRSGFSRCLKEDGIHMTEFGNEVLADAVLAAIRRLIDAQ